MLFWIKNDLEANEWINQYAKFLWNQDFYLDVMTIPWFGIHVVHLENANFFIQFFSNIGIQLYTTASTVYSAFEYTWI